MMYLHQPGPFAPVQEPDLGPEGRVDTTGNRTQTGFMLGGGLGPY